jgi:hypothetical protein
MTLRTPTQQQGRFAVLGDDDDASSFGYESSTTEYEPSEDLEDISQQVPQQLPLPQENTMLEEEKNEPPPQVNNMMAPPQEEKNILEEEKNEPPPQEENDDESVHARIFWDDDKPVPRRATMFRFSL